eukprot:TRINITY_DN3839_c0_g1_i3.p1 TRINITY_DN3839_c0_g1~~TRINITY_DN3839_c0_g1_i3.p1  ORF type:complete len:201 (-),score=25.76 TRINITY_DN3839_c0_g1_i3:29-631(-)
MHHLHTSMIQQHTTRPEGAQEAESDRAEARWKRNFLLAPYLRDALVLRGVIVETFETAVTWDKFDAFYSAVVSAVTAAIAQVCDSRGHITCRFTHIYPDGPAPYFTVFAKGKEGEMVAQWEVIKRAACGAIMAAGGTITHHHAVGRDHAPYWQQDEAPLLFVDMLRNAKNVVDPHGILNPGVLFDCSNSGLVRTKSISHF